MGSGPPASTDHHQARDNLICFISLLLVNYSLNALLYGGALPRPFTASLFLFTNIYSNTLVHSSPHLPVYCMGRWVRLHCFFQMGILDMIQHFMHEILVDSSHYFTSYCNESGHLCETLKGEGLVGQ